MVKERASLQPSVRAKSHTSETANINLARRLTEPIGLGLPAALTPICPDAPTDGVINMNFGMWSDIAEVITRAEVCVYRFMGFRDLIYFSLCLSGRPYLTVQALPCYNVITEACSVTVNVVV